MTNRTASRKAFFGRRARPAFGQCVGRGQAGRPGHSTGDRPRRCRVGPENKAYTMRYPRKHAGNGPPDPGIDQ